MYEIRVGISSCIGAAHTLLTSADSLSCIEVLVVVVVGENDAEFYRTS